MLPAYPARVYSPVLWAVGAGLPRPPLAGNRERQALGEVAWSALPGLAGQLTGGRFSPGPAGHNRAIPRPVTMQAAHSRTG
jgi:hypothetical protein